MQQVLAGFPEVELAYLFGSQAADMAAGPVGRHTGPMSDYDLAVLLCADADPLDLQARLANAFRRALDVEKVDVLLLENAPIELAKAVISTGVLLLEKDVDTRVEYEARVMSLYGDYLPVLRAFRMQILEGEEYEARVKWYRAALGRTERTLGSLGAAAREEKG